MLYDNHIHTEFSGDSEMKAADALETAAKLGMGLIFTEHMDIGYPDSSAFTFDTRVYWEKYLPLRSEKLRLGIEVGLTAADREANRNIVKTVPFDLVIGSIHLLDGQDIYYGEYYADKDKAAAYGHYLTVMADEVKANPFINVLGHIDYIARYAPYPDPALNYGEFAAEIDEVLRSVVATDTVLELNARRLTGSERGEELLPIYRRYRELGGRYVSIGSDAHTRENIGANFKLAWELAEAAKLESVTFVAGNMVKQGSGAA